MLFKILFSNNLVEPDLLDDGHQAGRHFRQAVFRQLGLGEYTLAKVDRIEGCLFLGTELVRADHRQLT